MRARAIAVVLLSACHMERYVPPPCDLAEQYSLHLQTDVWSCHTDNCVAWYVQREAIQRAACATERAGGLSVGVAQ